MTSPELAGGTGFTYEDAVAAHYLAALLGGTTAAGLGSRIVERVAQQQASFGEPLDDVIVDAVAPADGSAMRLSLQVKRALTISDASSNTDFGEVIQRSWQTLQKPGFRDQVDRVGAATDMISVDAFRNFTTVCAWARASVAPAAFMQRFADCGNGSLAHRAVVNVVRKIMADALGGPFPDDNLHRLFQHLTLIRFDFLHEGSTQEADVLANLQRSLVADQVGRAGELWSLLCQAARNGAGRSAEHIRGSLLRGLEGGWRFSGTPALAADMQLLREGSRHWLAQQADDIGGMHLDRQGLRDQLVAQLAAHRLTLVKGLPGAGKTVLLRDLLQAKAADGTTLLLAANRLSGRSWTEQACALGLSATAIEPLLVEVAATGHPVLFIDGIDRVAPEHRPIITDLLGQLLASPALANWRVVATARDAGIEPLRNWVPAALWSGGGVGYVDVDNLSDDEAAVLADKLPALRPLLTGGNERVRTLARRPFFAAVLARGLSRAAYPAEFAPQTEVELVDAWWMRGGYDALAPQALARQRALIELAQRSAPDLGRNLRIRDLSAATQAVLPDLEEDGLLQQVRQGHTAQFSHDIFFEWSFFHLLVDQGPDWIATLTAAGEPPALARVVELLSQSTYANAEQWLLELHALAEAQARPQWLRAWLIAPVFSPRFAEHAEMYGMALSANDHRLLGKLLVWMQAEKTTPNPMVLSGLHGSESMPPAARIRLADSLGWPSDFPAWRRLLSWLLQRLDAIPDRCLPDLVTLFETWQMAYADYPDQLSQRIVTQCAAWLDAIDVQHHARRTRHTPPSGKGAPPPRAPSNLETELRNLILRAGRAYPDIVSAYLSKIERIARWHDKGYQEVMAYAPLLAQTHPALLAQVARRWFLQELPDDSMARWHTEDHEREELLKRVAAIPADQRTWSDNMTLESPNIGRDSFSHHDWDRLSIGADHQGYFPASPLREPFDALFQHDPATGLALVRDVVNHSVIAWRQLHQYRGRAGTPLPLVLAFSWGAQEFWGADRHYVWFRGHGGPQAVECALMALERWAMAQQDAGRSLEDLLKQMLEGHASISVLGIAVHLALRAKEVSATSLTLLGSLRLCDLDLQRMVQESELVSAGLIGFKPGRSDDAQRQAVVDNGQLASRRLELRNLVPLFVLSGDAAMRDACRVVLDSFPHRLEFSYQEEADDPDTVAEMRHKAELWSELGHVENYRATAVPGRDDAVQLSVSSARHEAPEVQATLQRHAQVARETELWLWVDKCFSSWSWAPAFSPDEAVTRATELADADPSASLMPGSGISEAAVVGTAAALICFDETAKHRAWADATIARYGVEPEAAADDTFLGAVIPWHPKIFVARALAARVRAGAEAAGDREALYRLVAHPMEVVSFAALSGVSACWECDPRFAWCGLNLGLRLAQLWHRSDAFRMDAQARRLAEQAHRDAILAVALEEYQRGGDLPAWVRPLPSWTPVAPGTPLRQRGSDGPEGWQRSSNLWHSQYAAKVLQQVPVAAVMASPASILYVDALEGLVEWTLDTLNPTWRTDERHGREHDGTSLFEWEHQLGRSLASAASHLPATEVQGRLLAPIVAQCDETAMRCLGPFSEVLFLDVLTAATINDSSIQLLQSVLERTLDQRDLRRSPYNDDGRIGGFDLPDLIKCLMFVRVERADDAARFANGRWEDLPRIMPLVDRMVRVAGWVPYVARQFVTLVERAGAAYPADTFADQVLALIVDGNLPTAWKGTSVPASIAALVQENADRLHPLSPALARKLLHVLDALVDLGDRRSAALQQSESFRGVRLTALV